MRICLTDYKMYRPFKVTEVLPENDFKLQLPPGMHYYNSFNVSLLRMQESFEEEETLRRIGHEHNIAYRDY